MITNLCDRLERRDGNDRDDVQRPSRLKTTRETPKVAVYSRHRAGCKWAGDDRRLGCDCPKMLSWYRGKLHRISAQTCDGQVAEGKARDLEAGFKAAVKGEPLPEKKTGKLLEDAMADFLRGKEQNGITAKHVAKLRYELGEFSKFALAKGLVMVADIQTEHVLIWRNALQGAQNTRAKKVFRLIGFFEFCVEMGWVLRNVARAQSIVIQYSDQQEPKALTDAQFECLLAAIPKVNGRTSDGRRRKLRSLLLLMRWTGLAIRDAVCIERARFEKSGKEFWKVFLRRAKTGHPVFCTLKSDILEQIMAGANPNGRWLFVERVPEGEKELDNMVQTWATLMRNLGEVAQLKDEHDSPIKFHSHMLRHTFVSWCLHHGLPTEDVAALIGDSVQIVARHYSGWIAGRQERLSERMMYALRNGTRER